MKRTEVGAILSSGKIGDKVNVKGWVKAYRSNRFIQINDGSTINNVQAVIEFENFDEALIKRITVASAVSVVGILVESQGKGQKVEIDGKPSLEWITSSMAELGHGRGDGAAPHNSDGVLRSQYADSQ